MSLRQTLRGLLLLRDIRETTEDHYHRVIDVFVNWRGRDDNADFTAAAVSEMLRDKAREGRSPYYLRSLRSCLCVLLRAIGDRNPVRPVRLPRLERIGWTSEEVVRLFVAARGKGAWWGSLVEAAYYTGLSLCDLLELRGEQIDEHGWVRTKRRKTGAAVLVAVPRRLAGELREAGQERIWPWAKTLEWFRRQFREILREAGLTGSFKMLRAASGSAVEAEHPGAGHRHLANTPQVFERHYQTRAAARPTMPPEV